MLLIYPLAACCQLRGRLRAAPAFSGGTQKACMMETWVYIDGLNLYYGAVKNTPYKWLDLSALCTRVLPKHLRVGKIRYFTARVLGAADPGAPRRQQMYIKALETLPAIDIHYGRFLTKTLRRPLNNLPIGNSTVLSTPPVVLPPGEYEIDDGLSRQKMPVGVYPFRRSKRNRSGRAVPDAVIVEVCTSEEKGSDVNLAAHLLNDAWHDRFEAAAVITNDTDLIEPIRMVAQERKKPVHLICPLKRHPARGLAEAATYARHIREDMLKKSQFPDPIPGTKIHKPVEW